MKDVPSTVVIDNAHKWFKWALAGMIFSGIFMLAGVATKCYHNAAFWAKMIALATGIIFVFAIKQPLLRYNHNAINPWTMKLIAIASMMVWFTVAAAGRWIGFS